MTIHPVLFWLLVIFAGFGLICFVISGGILLSLLWLLYKEKQAERASFKALKKHLSSIDKAYR